MDILVKLHKSNTSYGYHNVKEVVFVGRNQGEFAINDKLEKVPPVRGMADVDKGQPVEDGEW